MPKISVIVPVYKVEKYLSRCIDSILAQTFKDFELILIDDGSPDGSGKICDEYAESDSRIIVIHQENSGVSAARNAGLKIAQGEYITFIDSDDWVDSDYLSFLYQLAVDNNADIACCTLLGIDENEDNFEIIKLTDNFNEEKNISLSNGNFEIGKWYSFAAPFCKLIKKVIIDDNKLQFDKSLTIGEDLVFYLQLMHFAKHVIASAKPKYHYFQRNDSAMHSMSFDNMYSDIRAWYIVCKMLSSKWSCFSAFTGAYIWKLNNFINFISKNDIKLTKEKIILLQNAFRLTRKHRHSLAKGVKFELLYFLLEYNISLYFKIAKKKQGKQPK